MFILKNQQCLRRMSQIRRNFGATCTLKGIAYGEVCQYAVVLERGVRIVTRARKQQVMANLYARIHERENP